MSARRVAIAVGLLLAASCSQQPHETFRGVWEYGFEHNRFRSADYQHGADEWGWCLSEGAHELFQPPEMPSGMHIGKYRLVVEAELSAPGHFGHAGLCERELRIVRLIESEHIGFECQYDPETCERVGRRERLVRGS